jgi:putative membrane protein
MKTAKRVLAGVVAAAILAPICSTPAKAAAPSVTTDEAVYVTLDYYGKSKQVSIVKGCSLNGNRSFTDYGSYQKVTNMSNEAKPGLSADSVSWSLPQGTDRFYYECTPKGTTPALPWNFDVSYKLNGVPAKAESLAGASGMVEIDVKATPNKNVSDYYKNNMLLQAGTYIKMSDTLSIEAPGAQIQSLGDYRAVLFAAIPGEEKTFTMRIGTKSFETPGIVLLMVPGTLEQFQKIKDLKEDKDKVKDSLDSVHDSVDEILGTLEGMSQGLNETQSGLSALDDARGTISSSKGKVYDDADKSIASLTDVTNHMAALVPHLQRGQQLVADVNEDVNDLVDTVSATTSTLNSLSGYISKIRSDALELSDLLDDADGTAADRDKLRKDLKSETKSAQKLIDDLKKFLPDLEGQLGELSTNANALGATLMQIKGGAAGDPSKLPLAIQMLIGQSATTLTSLQALNDSIGALKPLLEDAVPAADDLIDLEDSSMDVLDEYLDLLDDSAKPASDLLKHLGSASNSLKELIDQCDTTVQKIQKLNDTANKYRDGSIQTLQDLATMTGSISGSLTDIQSFLTSLELLTKTSGEKLDSGTKKTLNGLIALLRKSLDGVGDLSTVTKANDTIQNTINKEIDKYENENNLLKMDPAAPAVSFTSSKNPSPASLQIVLRTQEISVNEPKAGSEDAEKAEESTTFFQRVQQVFARLWESITSVFSH